MLKEIGGMLKITPETNMQFCENMRVVSHNRKFFGHHDGPGKGGTARNMLLPSGIWASRGPASNS